jgi:hypothetical protein
MLLSTCFEIITCSPPNRHPKRQSSTYTFICRASVALRERVISLPWRALKSGGRAAGWRRQFDCLALKNHDKFKKSGRL